MNLTRREFLKTSGLIGFLGLVPEAEETLNLIKRLPRVRRNIIFLIGDGWPLGALKAYMEFARRVFNIQPYFTHLFNDVHTTTGLVITNSLSSIVTDSAPASVAWGTGSKTANRMLSVLPDGRKLKTICELAKEQGLGIGFVTTTRLTHATPAAWYSHNQNRDAEDDIALDLLKLEPDVALGGGSRHFDPKRRRDGRDLWQEFAQKGYQVINQREELKRVSPERPVLGTFNTSHLSYFIDRLNDPNLRRIEPTLPEMTAVALSVLSHRNPRGFVLQVEAGRIDHALHANDMAGGLYDVYEMDMTLGVILNFIKKNPDTLLIVTSDHGNSMYGINGTGPEYNHATEALLKYKNAKASFEYIKRLMRGKSVEEVRDIFINYSGFNDISLEEAQEIHRKLNEGTGGYYINDFWYEPEATMGRILSKSIYRGTEGSMETILRRGNVYFTGTNHTAEDQIYIIRSPRKYNLSGRIDNTELFKVMCAFLRITYENPKMSEEEYRSLKIAKITLEEWKRHLELHIA